MLIFLFPYFLQLVFLKRSVINEIFPSQRDKIRGMLSKFRFLQSELRIQDMPSQEKLPQAPSPMSGMDHIQGWIKFFIFDPNQEKLNEPPQFFQNNAFFQQEKYKDLKNFQIDNRNQDLLIPSPIHFFGVLNKQQLRILSSKKEQIQSTIAILDLKNCIPNNDQMKQDSIVEDVSGEFKEGFCFKVNVQLPVGQQSWVLCTEEIEDKYLWMSAVKTAINENLEQMNFYKHDLTQPSFNQETVVQGLDLSAIKGAMQSNQLGQEMTLNQQTNIKPMNLTQRQDGYWKVVSDWSSCTVACGSGTQTLQRTCIEPRNYGLPCYGLPILTRPCNEQPCAISETTQNYLMPRLKTMQFSSRPWRQETCIIKEADLDMVHHEYKQFQIPPHIPKRVLMNNKTFSVFQSDNYKDLVFSVPLEFIEVRNHSQIKDDKTCMDIIDSRNNTQIELCSLSTMTEGLVDNIQNWQKQIIFFKNDCKEDMKSYIPQENPIVEIKKKQLIDEQKDFNAQKIYYNPINQQALKQDLKNLTNFAMDSFQKELQLEKLSEQEEIDRELREEKEKRVKIEILKSKEESLERQNTQTGKLSRSSFEVSNLKSQIQNLKENIKNMIQQQKERQEQKIQFMRKVHNKTSRDSSLEIQELKVKMAKNVLKAYVKGNMTNCRPDVSDQDRVAYCNKNFDQDIQQNQDCIDPDEFCFVCCEQEFGSFHQIERQDCFAQCGQTSQKDKGQWVYVSQKNKIPLDSKI